MLAEFRKKKKNHLSEENRKDITFFQALVAAGGGEASSVGELDRITLDRPCRSEKEGGRVVLRKSAEFR